MEYLNNLEEKKDNRTTTDRFVDRVVEEIIDPTIPYNLNEGQINAIKKSILSIIADEFNDEVLKIID